MNHVQAAFPCDRSSPRRARELVVSTLESWGVEERVDDAELVTGELVANAVLHAATPLGVLVSHEGTELTLEVRDELPVDFGLPPRPPPGPAPGSVSLDEESMTGRGLTLVSAVVDEWGIDVDRTGKTVWTAMRTGDAPPSGERRRAVAEDAGDEATGPVHVADLVALPTSVVLANVANLDDRVRELSLLDPSSAPGDLVALADAFTAAARATAVGRLRGRRAARAAAARGEATFTTNVAGNADAVAALDRLGTVLSMLDEHARAGRLLVPPAPPEVVAFRAWVVAELSRQLDGHPPSAYAPAPRASGT